MREIVNIHKEKQPEETINLIRGILAELNILVRETKWTSLSKHCHSVSLASDELQVIANGKGISRKYALAGAYAEFMERLQNNFLIRNKFGLMYEKIFFPDENTVSLEKLSSKHPALISSLLRQTDSQNLKKYMTKKEACIPYYHVDKDRVEFLPNRLIEQACASNGLCAGNTAEEALCQGICEIFERYAIKKIYKKYHNVPTIPLSSIKNSKSFKLLQETLDRGYRVIVKDCTFGGKLPVLGLILLDKKNNKYKCTFASDPIFDVALSRCITELFQGQDGEILQQQIHLPFVTPEDRQYFEKLKDNHELIRSFLNNTGRLPNYIFLASGRPAYLQAFQKSFRNHKYSLKFLVNKIKKLGFSLYVRDNSYLGFPSFRVYVPGMSELFEVKIDNYHHYEITQRCLSRIKKNTSVQILRCAQSLEHLISNNPSLYGKLEGDCLSKITNIKMSEESDIHVFSDPALLLAFLFYYCRHYAEAFNYLKFFLNYNKTLTVDRTYYLCVLAFINLRMKKLSYKKIAMHLSYIFEEKVVGAVIEDFKNPLNVFKNYKLPECGDCTLCPAVDTCLFKYRHRLNAVLKKKIGNARIKQDVLANHFK